MSIGRAILIKSLVKPFYRQNAGLLGFVIFMMTGAVGRANDVGLLEYHYSLIRGMLINPLFFILVLSVWLLYARKSIRFVAQTIRRPEFSFLYTASLIDSGRLYGSLILVQLILLLPICSYALIVAGVGIHLHWYGRVIQVLLYNLALCLAGAGWYLYLLRNPGSTSFTINWKMPVLFPRMAYQTFFIRYLLSGRKWLLMAIKIYSCGVLYLMVVRQLHEVYDLGMIMLFYSFGLLGHGVIIHQFRELEESRMAFYRGLPVSLAGRFARYGRLYFLLFIPEIAIIISLTPAFLHYRDAFLLVFFGYSLLLLLNSILFIKALKMSGYLKITVILFFLTFIAVLSGMMVWLTILYFLFSIYFFFSRYYRYEG